MEHLNVFNGLTPVFYGTRMEHTEHLNVFNDLAALSYSPYWYQNFRAVALIKKDPPKRA